MTIVTTLIHAALLPSERNLYNNAVLTVWLCKTFVSVDHSKDGSLDHRAKLAAECVTFQLCAWEVTGPNSVPESDISDWRFRCFTQLFQANTRDVTSN